MLKLKCCGTGSKGNSYALMSQNETLILDVGMRIKDIKKMCDWNVKNIVGCLISHEHYTTFHHKKQPFSEQKTT